MMMCMHHITSHQPTDPEDTLSVPSPLSPMTPILNITEPRNIIHHWLLTLRANGVNGMLEFTERVKAWKGGGNGPQGGSLSDFANLLKDFDLKPRQVTALFSHLCPSDSGMVDPSKLIDLIRFATISARRQHVLIGIFEKLDVNMTGTVDVMELVKGFQVGLHRGGLHREISTREIELFDSLRRNQRMRSRCQRGAFDKRTAEKAAQAPPPPPPPPVVEEQAPPNNGLLAAGDAVAGVLLFFFTRLGSGASFADLDNVSVPLDVALTNGKPTVVELEVCREMLPDAVALEAEYAGKVNYVTLNSLKGLQVKSQSRHHYMFFHFSTLGCAEQDANTDGGGHDDVEGVQWSGP
ncbi:hypothetical protein BSKO_04142 [Bryopsis sp. KO-2023]|nr:hypothetical protein BSKO_04142 [Bryopsis sp. KO-2023]